MGLILAGALQGAGAGAMQFGAEQQKQWGAENLEKMREDAAMARQDALLRAQQAHDVNMVGVREKTRREGALHDVQNVDPLRNKNALDLAKDTAQAKIDIESSPENVQKRIDSLKQLGPVEAQIKLDAEMQQLAAKSTPEALRALGAIARATQVLTPGQVAEGQIKQLELSKAKLMDAMQSQYATAVETGDTAKANGIVQAMTARFFDPAKLKDQPELRAAQAMLTSMDSTPEQKAQAGDFIMRALTSMSAKMGGAQTSSPQPTDAHVTALKSRSKDPRAVAAFEAQYGKGSAAKYLNAGEASTYEPGTLAEEPVASESGGYGEEYEKRGIIGVGVKAAKSYAEKQREEKRKLRENKAGDWR